jgi:hypothetical protein
MRYARHGLLSIRFRWQAGGFFSIGLSWRPYGYGSFAHPRKNGIEQPYQIDRFGRLVDHEHCPQ